MTGIAFAQSGVQSASSSGWMTFVPLVLMILIFYFLLIRPQQKKEKERKNMIAALQKGDKVITAGGICGVITEVKDNDRIIVKIADKTNVEFTRSAIQTKIP